MTKLGFFGQTNKWTHDHSFAISYTGHIDSYLQLERWTRRKYDNRLPDFLTDLVLPLGLDFSQTEIGYANTFALGDRFFKQSDNDIHGKNIEISHEGTRQLKPISVTGKLNGEEREFIAVPHEIAHIFSSIPFYGLFRDNSLLVHIDGAASICNASAWLWKNGKLELLESSSILHHTLLNFSYNDVSFDILNIPKAHHFSMPGKLMGFASFGSYHEKFHMWLQQNDFFRDYANKSMEKMLSEANQQFGYNITSIKQKHDFSFNFAYAVQYEFTSRLFNFIRKHQEATGSKFLYYSGGAALNIKLNSYLVNSQIFEDIYVPPPSGDSGLSLGVVSYLNWQDNIYQTKTEGQPYLNTYGLKVENTAPTFSPDEVARDLVDNKIVGIFTGAAEAGPRALGHRSLLAIPSDKKLGEKLSRQIKGREWYRPIAPVLLETETEYFFENYTSSPITEYMLYDFKVRSNRLNEIPAVVHIDETARAQVVKTDNKDLKILISILETLRDRFGVHCLINTSFNSAGEPIVHTAEDARRSARKMGVDKLIINDTYEEVSL